MTAIDPESHALTDRSELRTLYRQPSDRAVAKDIGTIDSVAAQFISRSPLVLIATTSSEGLPDVSPRGGDVGFVKAIGSKFLAIPDMVGNNRLDSLTNVVDQGHAGLIFLVPGSTDTLRANGKAWITTDPDILSLFTEVKKPTSAILIEVVALYSHCAKSLMRAKVWDTETWNPSLAPTGPVMIKAHVAQDATVEEIAEHFDERFATQLSEERADAN